MQKTAGLMHETKKGKVLMESRLSFGRSFLNLAGSG